VLEGAAGVQLVEARPADDPEFSARLMEYWWDLGVVPPQDWHARYLRRLGEEQGRGRHTLWGTAAAGRVGFAVLRLDADFVDPERRLGYIAEFSVFPRWRRQGWGRQQFTAVRGWFAARGCRDLELDVLPSNARAQAFWSALGFLPAYQHLRLGPLA